MKLELRDELAARIAAALADSTLSPRQIAIRAYATADAMLAERAGVARVADELGADHEVASPEVAFELDPGPPHDPRWELEPRWRERDREALERARERHDRRHGGSVEPKPGLASGRPVKPSEAEKTG